MSLTISFFITRFCRGLGAGFGRRDHNDTCTLLSEPGRALSLRVSGQGVGGRCKGRPQEAQSEPKNFSAGGKIFRLLFLSLMGDSVEARSDLLSALN